MIAQTIPELTNYQYNELTYNISTDLIVGNFIYQICDLLDKCYINIKPTNIYDYDVANAVAEFQSAIGITPTGILTTSTLQAMILYSDKVNDEIESGEEVTSGETVDNLLQSPHYGSFFDDENYKLHRRNSKDIKIVFGNNSITKTIKNVFMRSVTVEVDTSGNPISEVYEFIAQDVTESDEMNDINKYSIADITDNTTPKRDYSLVTK